LRSAFFAATRAALTAAAIRAGRISRRAVALSALAGAGVRAAAVARRVYGIGAHR
jgi:hypothetical protein